ncbi:MAG: exodeoxyribonuclease V subunit beta [Lentisphaerota bacterium]
MREFDLLCQPLRAGTVSLIEASAGTGKTTAIENLFIRLLLEGIERDGENIALEVKQILVVTFTEAATAELVDRVRRNIFRAIELLDARLVIDNVNYLDKKPEEIPDILIRLLVNYLTEDDESGGPDRRKMHYANHLLHVALSDFDEASISTIHGFCSRMLNEFAFESGVPFGAELIADDRLLVDEVAADYWRQHFYAPDSKLKCAAAEAGGLNPAELSRMAGNILKTPGIKLSVEENIPDAACIYADLDTACERLSDFFVSRKAEICGLLQNNQDIFKADFRRELPDALYALSSALGDNVFSAITGAMKLFDPDYFALKQQKKKVWKSDNGLMPPVIAELLELCKEFKQTTNDFCVAVKTGFVRYLRDSGALKMKKRQLQVQSFDDLLSDMHTALGKSTTFAARIRQRFKVALIDEFQDTDPVQYDIFRLIFQDKSTLMLMVGDPKQSIYAFRGADIYSYLHVAGGMDDSCSTTLTKNFRSSGRLLEAFNAIFGVENPFVEKDIKHLPAVCGREPDRLVIEGENIAASPFKLWMPEQLSKTATTEILCRSVAAKIAWLLQASGRTDSAGLPCARFEKDKAAGECECRAVKASDIAVLTLSNQEARQMREALADAGVPAVLQNSGNVFNSDAAGEIYHVLRAVAVPGRDPLLRTALATAMFGFNGEDIAGLDDPAGDSGEPEIELWRQLFLELNTIWRERGFVQMFFRMLREDTVHSARRLSIRENLLALPLGERHLTDLLHLGELLHQASRGGTLGLNGLIAWLHERILRPEDNEEHEQRLESDDDAVKIMTVHKSKGLQFPVVFCPFIWSRGFSYGDEKDFLFHEQDSDGVYKLFFEAGHGDIVRNRIRCRREKLAESLRLLYVALTRAKQFCCVAWGGSMDSALMYLARNWADTDLRNYLEHGGKGMSPGLGDNADKWRQCDAIKWEKPFADSVRYESERKQLQLEAKKQSRPIPADWGIMSFSSLSAGTHTGKDQSPGWDDGAASPGPLEDAAAADNEPESALADFPAGPVSGDCIHEIFEELDFAVTSDAGWRKLPEVKKLISDKLQKFGRVDSTRFDDSLAERSLMIGDMLENVLNTPVTAGGGTFRLAEVARRRRVSEMEFFFQVSDPVRLAELSKLLQRNFHPETAAGLEHIGGKAPRRGFMNGKIDLFFEHGGKYWIADWKTNWMGRAYRAYNHAALNSDMIANSYLMQAAIYVLAVDKFLRFRVPGYDYNRHFGGVFYLFVRGMDGRTPDQGVFTMRPELDFIRELAEIFTGGAQ